MEFFTLFVCAVILITGMTVIDDDHTTPKGL